MPFEQSTDALATPQGLADACRKARIYVEANIPGDHKPVPGCFWRRDQYDQVIGCGCAVGYLLAALAGSLWIAACRLEWSKLYNYGVPVNIGALCEFSAGFDMALIGDPIGIAGEWGQAGHQLGREWRPAL